LGAIVFFVPRVHAIESSYVSDTITDSRDGWPANHTILFQVPDGIPASGQLVINFEHQPFIIDPSFSYTDVDFAVATDSPMGSFSERSLLDVPDATNDGIAINPSGGPLVITLSSGSDIPPGAYVRIMLGTNAPAGVYQIINPSSTASYRILLNTYTSSSTSIDYGAAMVAILPAIGVSANTDKLNPAVLSNGMPSGTIPSNVLGVLVSFNTDTYATCRYATSSGLTYDQMANATNDNQLGNFHTFSIIGIVQGTTYTYYARCVDFAGNKNPADYIISFFAGDPTGTGRGGGKVGTGGSGGSGGAAGGGGGGAPYPAALQGPSLFLRGITIPNSTLAVLQDGMKISTTANVDGSGNFLITIPSVAQGTYSFTVQVVNNAGTPITSYTSAITLLTGTNNSITNIILPPAINFSTSTVGVGKSMTISGLSEPSSTIDLLVTNQNTAQLQFEATTTANQSGVWSYALGTTGFSVGTYQIKARALVPGFGASTFSTLSFLGVGEAANPKVKIGDLNGDGKVNLADFSILLYHWGSNYAPAEFDGKTSVDLQDLSIMLFNWTG
jgi:hypothetical protein